jgi:hypothetical protein
MVAAVHADITPLLETLGAGDETRVIEETLELLGPAKVPPGHIAARVAIPAAWAGGDGHPLMVLGAAGHVAEWMRSIPAGPEPGADVRAKLAPALPLVQGFMAVAPGLAAGMREPHPDLPTPLTPFEVQTETQDGALPALRKAFAAGDRERFGRILMGFYRVGADYRALLAHLYAVLVYHYPAGGHPLSFATGSSQVLDMADWGDRVPPFIHWLLPLVMAGDPDEPCAQVAREFGTASEHSLAWLRTRLAVAKDEAAGPQFRRTVIEADGTAACEAVLAALRAGARPAGVASGLAVAAAERLLALPAGDRDALVRAAHVLLYTHAVHTVMLQTQDPEVFPLLYTAATAVSAMPQPTGAPPAARAAPTSTPMLGGLIAPALLRSLEHQLADGDTVSALATARRYIQMGHSPRGLAGILGSAASRRDPRRGGLHTLPLVAAAADEYLSQPGFPSGGPAPQGAGQSPLLAAAVRLASELPGDTALAARVDEAIAEQARSA